MARVLCFAAGGGGEGAGGAHLEVCQGPERQPRCTEVHRVRRPTVPAVHHRVIQGKREFRILLARALDIVAPCAQALWALSFLTTSDSEQCTVIE